MRLFWAVGLNTNVPGVFLKENIPSEEEEYP